MAPAGAPNMLVLMIDSIARNLAAEQPQRLRRLQDLWWAEAAKHQALPLDDRMFARVADRRATEMEPASYTFYRGTGPMPAEVGPNVKHRSHRITADVEVPEVGGEGLIVSSGGTPSGFALFFEGGKLVYAYNYLARQNYRIESPKAIVPGKHTLGYEFALDATTKGAAGGTGYLLLDGQRIAETNFERTVTFSYASDETFDIGEEFGSLVLQSFADKLPFRFNGKIGRVNVEIR